MLLALDRFYLPLFEDEELRCVPFLLPNFMWSNFSLVMLLLVSWELRLE